MTRVIMSASAIVLLVFGAACLFAPQELAAALELDAGAATVIQVLAAAYLGFAAANWMARNTMIGGIYARPLASANFLHFGVGAISLAKIAANGSPPTAVLVATGVYVLFSILFALILFGFVGGPARSVSNE